MMDTANYASRRAMVFRLVHTELLILFAKLYARVRCGESRQTDCEDAIRANVSRTVKRERKGGEREIISQQRSVK